MRVFVKGHNLYGQLHGNHDDIVANFKTFEVDDVHCVEISYTYSAVLNRSDNSLTVFSNCCESDVIINLSDNIVIIRANENFILLLTKTGCILKIPTQNFNQIERVPKFTQGDDQVTLLSAGLRLNIAYSKNKCLYSIPEQLELENHLEIVDIQTGREHAVLLDASGQVYTLGNGSRGQLGHGFLGDCSSPQLVEALAGICIVRIAAGGWHSAAVSNQGDLYQWGWNGNGQLGIGSVDMKDSNQISVLASPRVIDINGPDTNILHVACGSRHTIALTDNNKLFGSGWNKYKQLLDNNVENIYTFTYICDFGKDIVEGVKCGPWNSMVICR